MNPEFIISLPIFKKEEKIRNLSEFIYDRFDNFDYLILVDKEDKVSGCVKLNYLLKVMNLGTQLGWSLESIMEENIIIIKERESNIAVSLKEDVPIIIVDDHNKPLGILNKFTYLQNKLKQTMPNLINLNEWLMEMADFGFLLVSSNRIIVNHNKYAQSIISNQLLGKNIDSFYPGNFAQDIKKEKANNWVNDKFLEWNFYPLGSDANNKSRAIYILDRTETEKLTREIKKMKNNIKDLYDIIEHSHDEIFVTDDKGVCTFVNKASHRFYGLPKEEMIGKTAQQLEDEGIVSSNISHKVISQKRRITTIQSTATGRKIIVTATPIFNNENKVSKVIINARELTELSNIMGKFENSQSPIISNSELNQLTKIKLMSEGIIIESPSMRYVISTAQTVSQVNSNVLILGESGVGKGIIAKLIHELSPRSKERFIKVNCGAIPETLIESELFGYEKGAFTGAVKEGKKGLFELAHEGTIFLDEIGEIPLHIQTKLLQAIQDKEIMRVGGTKSIYVNCRIIAATNKNLNEMVREGKFREDLYYRLNVIPIQIPSLKDRKEEIPSLVQNFIHKFNQQFQKEKTIDKKAVDILVSYPWPGNIRELENSIERAIVTSPCDSISTSDLAFLEQPKNLNHKNSISVSSLENIDSLKKAVEKFEKEIIETALEKYKTTYEVAKILKVNQSTIVRKIDKYRIV
ncbi:sigma-54 interaction domain-containing protein [Oceanobacillus jeddahense]|uniref:sigma-54 interaction domain-containing protein n=1 Tax=Oceanobacillus jeddahense TaxID=1462527 RepID=UPI0009DE95CD|nr:sigma 54-interacting transcriptional regulator [Oceanobacillus jeddahense]